MLDQDNQLDNQNDQDDQEFTRYSVGDHSVHVSGESKKVYHNVFDRMSREEQDDLLKEARNNPSRGSLIKDGMGRKFVVKTRAAGGYTLERKK